MEPGSLQGRWSCRSFSLPQASNDLEGQLLFGIAGHNICLDVFGAHSAGEVAAGMAFHGEAGLTYVVNHRSLRLSKRLSALTNSEG